MPTTDTNARLPASVTVTFPRKAGTLTGEVYAATAVTLSSLSLPEAGVKPGHPGSHYARHSARALGTGTPSNSAALATLATQYAGDWYRWQLGWCDLALAGNVPWTLEGFHDVEWSNRPGHCLTRVRPAEIVRHLEEVSRPAASAEGHWVRITSVSGLKAAGVEVEPAGDGLYQDATGGITHAVDDQPLYETNDLAGAPVGAVVWVRPGAIGDDGQEWIYDWGWIPAVVGEVHDEETPTRYVCTEQVLGDAGTFNPKTDGRTFENCFERNDHLVAVGTNVWLYRGHSAQTDGDIEELWFDYEPQPSFNPDTGCVSCLNYTVVNVADVTTLTGLDAHLYYNLNDETWYFYSSVYGWFPWCCATGSSGTGSGGGAVPTDCQDEAVSQDLVITISDKTGACTCVADDTLEYFTGDPAPAYPTWTQAHAFSGCPNESSLSLVCREGTWYLTGTNLIGGSGQAPDTQNAAGDPLELVWNNLDGSGICGGAGTFTITITEAP